MILIANIMLDPAAIASWLVAGLATGWLLGKMTEEPSYGIMGDLIAGALGGLIGGLLYGLFMQDAGFWGGLLVALISSCVLIVGARYTVAGSST